MDVDWDLHAVVRGCASVTTTSSGGVATSSFMADLYPQSCFSSFGSQEAFQGQVLPFPNQFEAGNATEELDELYKPFFPKSQPLSQQSTPLSSLSSIGLSKDQAQIKQQEEQQRQPKQSHAGSVTSAVTTASSNSATANSHNSRSKRR